MVCAVFAGMRRRRRRARALYTTSNTRPSCPTGSRVKRGISNRFSAAPSAGTGSSGPALPPVLPVVLYNGRRPWTVSVEMTDLVAVGSDLLAPYQPSQRYHLLDGARVADADLPADNFAAALIALEKTRDAAHLREALQALQALSELLRAQADDHLTQAFVTWLHQGLGVAGPLPAGEGDPLTQLRETQTMLEENVREWTREWLEQGRAQGIEQGRHEERALLCRLAARKFDAGAAEELAAALAGVTDPARLARVGDWIIECATASELLARVRSGNGSGSRP